MIFCPLSTESGRLTYITYLKHAPNVGHDFEHVQVAMGNPYANENAEMDFFPKFQINVDLLYIETS